MWNHIPILRSWVDHNRRSRDKPSSTNAKAQTSSSGYKKQVISGSKINERKLQNLLNHNFGCDYILKVSMLHRQLGFQFGYANGPDCR